MVIYFLNFSLKWIIYFCGEILNGMKYLETCGIIHGHLSPRSCLINQAFGLKIASPRGPNLHAQLRYSAPEAIILVILYCFINKN